MNRPTQSTASGETVYVLGAGFSAHAGMPLVHQLRPLVFDWLDAHKTDPRVAVHMKPLANWPEFPRGKFWDSLQRIDPAGNRGFEEWMVDLRRQEREYPASVQAYHVLRYACEELLWEKQRALAGLTDAYLHFARRVRSSLGIISYNWDLVCELSLELAGVPWGYSTRTAPIPVVKPHGSNNWSANLMQADWGRTISNPPGFMPIGPGSAISFMPERPFDDPLLQYDPRDLRCIVYPGIDEFLDHDCGPRATAERTRMRAEVLSLIGRACRVVFIGYSLPAYDADAIQMLRTACSGKTILVCNPSPEVIERFGDVFGREHLVPEQCRFEHSSFGAVI